MSDTITRCGNYLMVQCEENAERGYVADISTDGPALVVGWFGDPESGDWFADRRTAWDWMDDEYYDDYNESMSVTVDGEPPYRTDDEIEIEELCGESEELKITLSRARRIIAGIVERDANSDWKTLCDTNTPTEDGNNEPEQSESLAQLLADAQQWLEDKDTKERE